MYIRANVLLCSWILTGDVCLMSVPSPGVGASLSQLASPSSSAFWIRTFPPCPPCRQDLLAGLRSRLVVPLSG